MRIYDVKIKESGLSSRFDLAEERIRELELKFIEIIHCGEQKGKRQKMNTASENFETSLIAGTSV